MQQSDRRSMHRKLLAWRQHTNYFEASEILRSLWLISSDGSEVNIIVIRLEDYGNLKESVLNTDGQRK